MKKRTFSLFLALLLLTGCGGGQSAAPENEGLSIVATTYPVYLFTTAITEGVEGVRVERLNTGETSCLHDYTLSVNDMKLLEKAYAQAGIREATGARKSAMKNIAAVNMEERPVRPPAPTPAEDSTKEVPVEDPQIAPVVVATASASIALSMLGTSSSPFSFSTSRLPPRQAP